MFRIKLTSITLILSTLIILPVFAEEKVPVMFYPKEPSSDACGAWATVDGLDPNGDNFLALRTGPGTEYEMIAKLKTDDMAIMCGEEGPWESVIIYDGFCDIEDASSPVSKEKAYGGSCKSGWVYGKYVTVFAG